MKSRKLKVRNVTECIIVNKYGDDLIYTVGCKDYFILRRNYTVIPLIEKKLSNTDDYDYKIEDKRSNNNSFIIDMNGIDNFIFAKSLFFNDSLVRKFARSFASYKNKKYSRFGVAGCPLLSDFPGGEVLEYQKIKLKNGNGISYSVCGALNNGYSRGIPLSSSHNSMVEIRSVYSHTMWVKNENKYISLTIRGKKDSVNVLDIINECLKMLNIKACGLKIDIPSVKKDSDFCIRGRVLKYVPSKKMNELQEATDIADEKEYIIPAKSRFAMYGTYYSRFEPDWTKFTDGHIYERRGHFHAAIMKSKASRIHEVFHVRELFINKGSQLKIKIFPAEETIRIYPVHNIDGVYYLDSNNEDINKLKTNWRKFINETS